MAEHNTNPGGPGTDNPDPNPDPRPDEIPSPPPPPDIPIPDPPPPPFGDPADPPKSPLEAEASNIPDRSAVAFVYCAAEAFETAPLCDPRMDGTHTHTWPASDQLETSQKTSEPISWRYATKSQS